MGNIPFNRRNIRRLTKNSSGTVSVSIPIEHAYALGWKKGQLVEVKHVGKQIIITDNPAGAKS
jgi:hypothetical protein